MLSRFRPSSGTEFHLKRFEVISNDSLELSSYFLEICRLALEPHVDDVTAGRRSETIANHVWILYLEQGFQTRLNGLLNLAFCDQEIDIDIQVALNRFRQVTHLAS